MAAQEADQAIKSHQSSYGLFIALMKYGAIVSFVVAMLVVFIISA